MSDVTVLLQSIESGDQAAAAQLLPLVTKSGAVRSGLFHRPQIPWTLCCVGCIARHFEEILPRRSGVKSRTRPLRLSRLARTLKMVHPQQLSVLSHLRRSF
jgi:hypothetical protein